MCMCVWLVCLFVFVCICTLRYIHMYDTLALSRGVLA